MLAAITIGGTAVGLGAFAPAGARTCRGAHRWHGGAAMCSSGRRRRREERSETYGSPPMVIAASISRATPPSRSYQAPLRAPASPNWNAFPISWGPTMAGQARGPRTPHRTHQAAPADRARTRVSLRRTSLNEAIATFDLTPVGRAGRDPLSQSPEPSAAHDGVLGTSHPGGAPRTRSPR